ncbi:amidohydrolase [uncultured Phenylobacterium sp.]|uniref:amidohydrolase family protein n=1 Tax=uncultured Phenylobacterium sp. TaxID=349273 RepID=UPI0025D6BFFB|nr:amidohydrolase family protein [uncultured Phenylobacterium sp.]
MPEPAPVEEVLEPNLRICDPHHHLWDFPGSRYMLGELLEDTVGGGHRVESTVFVECGAFYRPGAQPGWEFVGEVEFVNGVAAMAASGRYDEAGRAILACEGIVGRADLTMGAAVEAVLERQVRAGNGRYRGIRHAGGWDASDEVRNSHTNPTQGLYASSAFREGFSRLSGLGLSFEAWQYHPQLPEVIDLARAFPETLVVLDHVGGPLGIGPYAGKRDEVFAAWRANVAELAREPNVWVKLGGLGMPICGFDHHRRDVLPGSAELAEAWRPYIETCIEAFGPQRSMFESNFPVDRASCSYANLWNAFKRITAGASASEKGWLYRDAARRFYRLR